ncbi:receptor-type tyrosine-protein phosphatase T-like isoform X2 [Bacillus rossius redtenbacheri]|uniref:receptor-type tyrosine-protein phosphatase T-like isoform X2 n=1 Tax=Bacillus rossius redtenbacheri TaxID=93214 RepID=UPI002FDCDF75
MLTNMLFIRVLLGTFCTLQICFMPVKSNEMNAEKPDAALLVNLGPYRLRDLVCVAKGKAATSALVFFKNNSQKKRGINSYTISEGTNYNTHPVNFSIRHGWSSYNLFNTTVGENALLDYRWEGLQSFFTRDSEKEIIETPSSTHNWTINVSVKGNSNAFIHLCTEMDIQSPSCSQIIFGGWNNKESSYRIKKGGKIKDTKIPVHMYPKWWNHVKITVSNDTLEFQLGKTTNTFEIDFAVKYLVFSTYKGESLEWRIHKRTFDATISSDNYLLTSWFKPEENKVCLSFFYYIPLKVENAKLTIRFHKNDRMHTYFHTEYIENTKGNEKNGWNWFEKTIDIAQYNIQGYIYLKISAVFDELSWLEYPLEVFAVDDVRFCNPEGSLRVLQLQVTSTDYKDLPTCQLLQFPRFELTAQPPQYHSLDCPDAGHLLSNCSVRCGTFFNKDCDYVDICLPDSTGTTVCTCSRGHEGSYCKKCSSRKYGDFCSKECGKCIQQQTCDSDTGYCPHGCEQGYVPPLCDKTYPKLNKAPILIASFPTSLSFSVDFKDITGYGVPTTYQIQYKKLIKSYYGDYYEDFWTSEAKVPVNLNKVNVTLRNLSKLTNYTVRVILFVEEKMNDRDDVPVFLGKTTCEDVQVENLVPGQTFIKVSLHELNNSVSCDPADYTLELYEDGNSQYLYAHHYYNPDFELLEPYTKYTVKVVRWKIGVKWEQVVYTLEAAPTEPLNLNIVSISGNESTIAWQKPNKVNGILRKFNVVVVMQETWLLRGNVPEIREEHGVEKGDYTHQLKGLYPSTLYRVSVSGVTVSEGRNSTLSFKTPLVEPVFTEQLSVVPKSFTTSTVDISLPPASEYLTNTSAYFVMVGCESCSEDKDSVPLVNGTFWNDIWNHSRLQNCSDIWIAGEIKPKTYQVIFTIGNNTVSDDSIFGKNYVNRPLDTHATYTVVAVVVNQQGDKRTFATLELAQGPLNLFQALNMTQVAEKDGAGANMALIVILIIVLIIVPTIGYFIYKKRTSFPALSNSKLVIQMKQQKDDTCILKPPAPDPPSEDEEVFNDNDPQLPLSERLSCRVAIKDLENYVMKEILSGELQKQYTRFPRGQTQPWEYGKLPQNKPKNRYGNLIAYDHSRVVLEKLQGDEYSDYINANYIDGYNTRKMYIATQGPKPNTVDDFWRMVWQEQVHVISMLANIMENGKKKCEHYWPEHRKEVTHRNITILTESEQVFADYTIRTLKVSCEGEDRKVWHLHFTSWPDHGVPFYPRSVASYLKKLLATPKGPGPILVHCSAGVGRTGTIILTDICLRMAAAERAVDMLHYLQSLREQRPNMVDNLEQFKLVHVVLLECLVEEQTSYTCNGLEKHVKKLEEAGVLVKQFQRLEELRNKVHILQQTDFQRGDQQSEETPLLHKNRFQNIVPGHGGRVYLSRNAVQGDTSDYINAVYVDGFRIRDQFIVTQYPLPVTVGDFWRMVVEKNISLIIMLNDLESSETVPEFRPTNDETLSPVPHLKIQLKQKSHTELWSIWRFHITDTGASQHQVVRMVHLTGWGADQDTPQEPSVLNHLWQEVETHYSGKGPTLVMCLDGARACGLFLAASFLIEKIKLEQQCDVCHAVRTIRQNRKQFITSQEQFEFLYYVAVNYLEAFSIYNNFD